MKDNYIMVAGGMISLVFVVLSIIEKSDISLLNFICGIIDGVIIGYWIRRE